MPEPSPIGSKLLFIDFDQSINGFHYTEKSKYDTPIRQPKSPIRAVLSGLLILVIKRQH